jgi:hypothetical protein
VRTRQLLLLIRTRINGGYLMSGFSIMVLLIAESFSSAMVVAFVMTISSNIITSRLVYGGGFRMMDSTACFFFLDSTVIKGLSVFGWLGAL